MTKHTEGPLVVYSRSNEVVIKGFFRVGHKSGHPGTVAYAATESDARLIATAPDLLVALHSAREWLSGWASAERELAVIDAAIAKATQP